MNLLTREVPVRKTNQLLRNIVAGFIAGIITTLVLNLGVQVGYDQGFEDARMGYVRSTVPASECGITDPVACVVQIAEAVVANPFRIKTVPSDAPYEKIIVQEDVIRIILRNLGDGKSRTFDFSRPITVVRTMCDDDGLLLECVQWTLPGAQYIDREIVWDMDVVSFVTVR